MKGYCRKYDKNDCFCLAVCGIFIAFLSAGQDKAVGRSAKADNKRNGGSDKATAVVKQESLAAAAKGKFLLALVGKGA